MPFRAQITKSRAQLADSETHLPDERMVELLIASTVPELQAETIARGLIREFGSLPTVLSVRPEELMRVQGVTADLVQRLAVVRAVMLRMLESRVHTGPILSNSKTLLDYLRADMAYRRVECFRVLFLNSKNLLIRDEIMGKGTVNTAPVYPREVIKRALELGAISLIMVHNHPSGDPKPSGDDIVMTHEIVAAGKFFDITVHDHLIIGAKGHTSFKAAKLLTVK